MKEFYDRFGPRADVQFFINMLKMGADSVHANGEPVGNFLAGIAFGEVLENFLLAPGEVLNFRGVAGVGAEGLNDAPGDLAAHGSTALFHFLDGLKDVGGIGALQEITARPGLEGAEDALIVFINCKDEDLNGRTKFLKTAGTVQTGHVRQMDVHENDIWQQAGDLLESFLGTAAGADTAVSRGFVHITREGGAEIPIVFNDGNRGQHDWKSEGRNPKAEMRARALTK
jgi:hypothetical protein